MLIERNTPKSVAIWVSTAITIAGLHLGAGYLVSQMQGDLNTVQNAPEAIMLEFALEPTAPDVEEISETIQPETTPDTTEEAKEELEEVKEVEREPIAELEPEQPLQESDMVEEVKQPEPKVKEVVKKEEVKPEQPKEEQKKVEPKKEILKAEKKQKSKGPQVVAKKGANFAAPATNRNFGQNNGRLVASWQNKVQKDIAYMATRVNKPRGIQPGTVAKVTFTFDAKGKILTTKIAGSSGNPELNDLALKIVQRASPIPTPPEGWSGALTVPVRIN